jgi:hypothetical protein
MKTKTFNGGGNADCAIHCIMMVVSQREAQPMSRTAERSGSSTMRSTEGANYIRPASSCCQSVWCLPCCS